MKQIEKSDSKRFYNKYYVIVRDCLDALRSSAMPDNSKLSEFISLVPLICLNADKFNNPSSVNVTVSLSANCLGDLLNIHL